MDSNITPDEYDFSHDIDDNNDCTWIDKCLTLRLGSLSSHQIDLDKLDNRAFEKFVQSCVDGKSAIFTIPGADCGQWKYNKGVLIVEVFDYGKFYGFMKFDLYANEHNYLKRLLSVLASIKRWKSLDVKEFISVEYP